MTSPDKILELVERFSRNLDAYKQGKYNEAQVRREFIDPLFEELGWDISNKKGYAEAYKEVINEDSVKVAGATKAPDYSFRIGGSRKFFLEAKKPSINIKDDISPAYQLRRYAWSAKLPLSILTDFEEFAVYDCRTKPVKTDKSFHSRILYLKYTDYPNRWEELTGIFSHEAILKGSFDRFGEGKTKRGTGEVDTAFLQEIEQWRDLLAKNISLRNTSLTQRELNFAVGRTIDRIIFLRICEDRGIEPYGNLMALLDGTQIYSSLCQLFSQADDRYNSGLFHFRQEKGRPGEHDNLTPNLNIDDKVLKEILKSLYYPDSPYEFSVLPADILGQVYEQFLGKVIRLTPSHRAVVEEKTEVRKAGGVYYTPTYIVDYITKQTVGKMIEEQGNPHKVSKLKILDPACGSGSFLLGAYQLLLDWHLNQYTKDTKGKNPKLYQDPSGQWRLTTDERKHILLNNIYGVDIDPQAVEVTKLSLLLKVLEGETNQTISHQFALFHRRVLPDLSSNIKCGNSLIGTDFYSGQQTILDTEEIYRVNAFDWQSEFPEIMAEGGFDVVIGNPPYFRLEAEKIETKYLRNKFKTPEFKVDIYTLFIEKVISQGFSKLGFIIPNNLMWNFTDRKLRKLILSKCHIEQIVNYKTRIFKDAVINSMVLILGKKDGKTISIKQVTKEGIEEFIANQEDFLKNENYVFDIHLLGKNKALIDKLCSLSKPFGELCYIRQAIKTGNDMMYVTEKMKYNNYKPVLGGKEINRYLIRSVGRFVDYGTHLACPRDPYIFEVSEKILIRETGKRITATYDNSQFYLLSSIYSVFLLEEVKVNIKYILGILNSNLVQFYMKQMCFDFSSGAFVKARIYNYKKLPIRTIDFTNPTDKALHDQMVVLVEQMLNLNKQLKETNLPQTKTIIQRQIKATDQQIDKLVYELYSLTDEEIAIVEENTKGAK